MYYIVNSLFAGFYIGFIVWGRSHKWLKVTSFLGGSGGMPPPRNFFEMNNFMRWDANWYILRHNCEKCYRVCIDLIDWFSLIFRYSYLYTVMITTFFLGGGSWEFGGGKVLPLKYPRQNPAWSSRNGSFPNWRSQSYFSENLPWTACGFVCNVSISLIRFPSASIINWLKLEQWQNL